MIVDRCGLCNRSASYGSNVKLTCRTCALSSVETVRVSLAAALIDTDKLRAQIESFIGPGTGPGEQQQHPAEPAQSPPQPTPDAGSEAPQTGGSRADNDDDILRLPVGEPVSAAQVGDGVNKWKLDWELKSSQDGLESIIQARRDLQKEVSQLRQTCRRKRVANQKHRDKAKHATAKLLDDERAALEDQQALMAGMPRSRQAKLANNIILTRRVLCREAAFLAGFRRRVRRTGSTGAQDAAAAAAVREEWVLGKVRIWDLRRLHEADAVLLNASLVNIVNLVARLAYYLGLDLPARLILPTGQSPVPAIITPVWPEKENSPDGGSGATGGSGDTADGVAAAASTGLHGPGQSSSAAHAYSIRDTPSGSGSISRSAVGAGSGTRPAGTAPAARPRRPLYLRTSLSKLRQTSPTEFDHFVEGVVLLGWDVAWLCRASGVGGFDEWDSVCDIGRNLLALLQHLSGPIGAQVPAAAEGGAGGGALDGFSEQPAAATARGSASSSTTMTATTTTMTTTTTTTGAVMASTTTTAASAEAAVPADRIPGRYSHATAHNFAGQASGGVAGWMSRWRLADDYLGQCVRPVRELVVAELDAHGWELVDVRDLWDEPDL